MGTDQSDQNALRELVSRYCRAIDRHDWPAVRDLYHPDATDDHGEFYRGSGQGFAEAARTGLAVYQRHMHSIMNSLFAVEGDKAEGETYFQAIAQSAPPAATHYQFGGRYLDRFERRDGAWRFVHRHVVHDWFCETPLTSVTQAMLAGMGTLGTFGQDDPSYTLTPMLARHFAGESA